MLPKIEKAWAVRASMALQAQIIDPAESGDGPPVNEDYGDTVPSRPHNIVVGVTNVGPATGTFRKQDVSDGVEWTGEGDFGTVVVHGGDEIGNTATQKQVSKFDESARALGDVESSISGTVVVSAEPWVENTVGVASNNIFAGESQPAHSIQASSHLILVSPEQNLKHNSSSQAQVGGGIAVSGSLLKSETVSRKAFALQDKLWSIYAAGNTVPIPFLRATDISPIALLSDNVLGGGQQDDRETVAVEALQELFTGDGQSKKGRRGQNEVPLPPSVHQRLTSSSTLLNLAQALAYHKMCYEEMPLQELQAAQEQQTIQNLCDTLRTILRL